MSRRLRVVDMDRDQANVGMTVLAVREDTVILAALIRRQERVKMVRQRDQQAKSDQLHKAIQRDTKDWIATSLTLLATGGRQNYNNTSAFSLLLISCFPPFFPLQ
jgi:hypothetical protein